jgi:hypothetical protein
MPGTPTVWSALPMASRHASESYQELGADTWRSQGVDGNLKYLQKENLFAYLEAAK